LQLECGNYEAQPLLLNMRSISELFLSFEMLCLPFAMPFAA
jgi:hypothetical protein